MNIYEYQNCYLIIFYFLWTFKNIAVWKNRKKTVNHSELESNQLQSTINDITQVLSDSVYFNVSQRKDYNYS